METMIELTIVFDNQSIPNKVLLTGPFDGDRDTSEVPYWLAIRDLRAQAEAELEGAVLKDEQCFYRFISR